MDTADRFSEALRNKAGRLEIAPPEDTLEGIHKNMAVRRNLLRAASACCCLAVIAAGAGIYALSSKDRDTIQRIHTDYGRIAAAISVERPAVFPGNIGTSIRAEKEEKRETHEKNNGHRHVKQDYTDGTQKTTRREPVQNDFPSYEYETFPAATPLPERRHGEIMLQASVSPGTVQYSPAGQAISPSTLNASGAAMSKNDIELEHSIPVSYGISITYGISKRWNVSAGIDYTLYKSQGTSAKGSLSQKLHYISIPVGASFDIYENDFFNFYITAGASLDKCVSGNVKYTFTDRAGNSGNKTVILDTGGIQGSFRAGAGMMFKIAPHMSVFAEPMYVRYFNGKNAIGSYRTAHVNGFNVSVGLRFGF